MAMPAMSSMAARRVTMAPSRDSSLEPSASVVVVTISIAMGIEATISTTVKDSASEKDVTVRRYANTVRHRILDTITSTITI